MSRFCTAWNDVVRTVDETTRALCVTLETRSDNRQSSTLLAINQQRFRDVELESNFLEIATDITKIDFRLDPLVDLI